MTMIQLHDKTFNIYIPHDKIQNRVKAIATEIQLNHAIPVHFVVVLNGAFMFASDLVKALEMHCKVSFIKVSSYEGLESTGVIKLKTDLATDIKGEHVIIIEDIIDSGNTVEFLMRHLSTKSPKSVEVCTLLFKPDAFQKNYQIDYCAFEIPNDFVVGYGMDYNQMGRNLKDLYVYKS